MNALTRIPSLFDLATGFDPLFRRTVDGHAPSVEIRKSEDEYVVTAHLPGVRKEDLNVSVEDGYLTISGKSETKEEKKYETVRSELVRFSEFKRSLKVDERSFDLEKIQAKLENGVLNVHLPIRAEVKPKQIDVKVS